MRLKTYEIQMTQKLKVPETSYIFVNWVLDNPEVDLDFSKKEIIFSDEIHFSLWIAKIVASEVVKFLLFFWGKNHYIHKNVVFCVYCGLEGGIIDSFFFENTADNTN